MIRVHQLHYAYPGSANAVITSMDLDVPSGQVTAITGPSGCGKSTTLYLCGLMLTPQSGDIFFGSHNTTEMSDAQRSTLRATEIGFVFQDAVLDPRRTVLENILEGAYYARMPLRDAQKSARQLLDAVGLEQKTSARVRDLSGGQAQRVALCRALVKDPTVLLADEPTGNLDDETGAHVMDHIFTHAHERGGAVLLVTHDTRLAQRCDRIMRWEDVRATTATLE